MLECVNASMHKEMLGNSPYASLFKMQKCAKNVSECNMQETVGNVKNAEQE